MSSPSTTPAGAPGAAERRVVWITGASRGLGAALAVGLAEPGTVMALMARSPDALAQVAEQVRERGAEVLVLAGSVRDPDDVAGVAGEIAARHGGLDVLVNNAGISPYFTDLTQLTDEAWFEVMDTNLAGVFRCCRAAVPLMSPGGSIVNVSSIHGTVGGARLAAYSASKGAVEALTRTLARELASSGIRVNAIAPGYFTTDMTAELLEHERWRSRLLDRVPMGRFGSPEELVGPVRFLAGPESSYVTGTTLFVDGGWTSG